MFDSSSDEQGDIEAFSDAKDRFARERMELQKENALLKTQFEEACQVAAQFQDLHKKYQQICSELRDLKGEKEDLSHRFEICVQNNHELTRQLAEERKSRSRATPSGNEVSSLTLERVRKEGEQKVEALTEELALLRRELQDSEMQRKLMESRIERVLQSGGHRFQTVMTSIDDLVNALESEAEPVIEHPPQTESIDTKMRRKIKKMKSKIASALEDKHKAESALKNLQSEAYDARVGDKKQIGELEARIAELTHESAMKDAQRQATVMKLEGKIEELKNENARLRETPRSTSQATERVVLHAAGDDQKLKELETSLNEASAKLATAEEQLRVAKDRREKAEKSMRESEENSAQMKLQIEKLGNEVGSLKTVVSEMQNENEMLRVALEKATKISEEPKQPVQPRVDVQARVKRLRQDLLEKQREILTLTNTVSSQQRKLEAQANEIREGNYKREQLEEQVSDLKSQVCDYKVREDARRNTPKPEPTLSGDVFLCSDLDSPLYATICKIISNSSLHLESKIPACMKAIVHHYIGKVEEAHAELQKLDQKSKSMAADVNQLLVDLSIALFDQPITLDTFLASSNSSAKFVKAVTDLRHQLDNAKRERDSFKAIVCHFSESFEEAKTDPITTIDELKKLLAYQNSRIVKKSKQLKLARSELSRSAKALTAAQDEASIKEAELNAQIEDLTQQLSSANRELATLKLKNEQLVEEVAEVQSARQTLEDQVQNIDTEFMERSQIEATEHIDTLTQALQEAKRKYKDLKSTVKVEQGNVARLTLLNQSLEAQLASMKDENQELNNILQLTEKRLNAQSDAEKDEIKESYERTITQLRDQCERHRSDVQKMAESRREMEELLNATEVEYARMSKEHDRMKHKVQAMMATMEREKKLVETSAAAKRIAYENEFEGRMNDLRSKCDADKRRICRYCAESLSRYFDPHHEINERSLRFIVDKAREDLDRLSNSDLAVRRLVNAREGQATEDAVAYALITPSM